MFTNDRLMGFVLTTDAKRARKFYETTLGLEFVRQDPFALVMRAGKNLIRISPVKELSPAQHTVLGWEVMDIERTAVELKERGVTFQTYPWLKVADSGIWTSPDGDRVAWFKDPDGNVLSIAQSANG